MPEQELNLIEFATGKMAQSCASASKVMPNELFMPARDAASLTAPKAPSEPFRCLKRRPLLLIDRKSAPSVMALTCFHAPMDSFTHPGTGAVRMCLALPRRSAMTQSPNRTPILRTP